MLHCFIIHQYSALYACIPDFACLHLSVFQHVYAKQTHQHKIQFVTLQSLLYKIQHKILWQNKVGGVVMTCFTRMALYPTRKCEIVNLKFQSYFWQR